MEFSSLRPCNACWIKKKKKKNIYKRVNLEHLLQQHKTNENIYQNAIEKSAKIYKTSFYNSMEPHTYFMNITVNAYFKQYWSISIKLLEEIFYIHLYKV